MVRVRRNLMRHEACARQSPVSKVNLYANRSQPGRLPARLRPKLHAMERKEGMRVLKTVCAERSVSYTLEATPESGLPALAKDRPWSGLQVIQNLQVFVSVAAHLVSLIIIGNLL